MKVYIIAEAGVNHNGSVATAKRLIDVAKAAGADCIKFQTFVSENVVTKTANKAEYQKQMTGNTEKQLDMLKKLELSFEEFGELNRYCDDAGIDFMSTAFDDKSIEFLEKLGLKKWKIPSGEITNLPYLIKIAKMNKPVILSTGMSTMDEIRDAVNVLKKHGSGEITVLHCTTEYPAPYENVNLGAMNTIRAEIGAPVGYSDHTRGIEIAIAAVSMGASVLEKHFTLDKNMEGPDHKASLEPNELKAMINAIRNVEKAIGSNKKSPSESEIKNMAVARKSIVAKRNIEKGEFFSEENITTKRPGTGITPMRWFDILGKQAKRNFEEDELIEI